jgi:hypothetical protein
MEVAIAKRIRHIFHSPRPLPKNQIKSFIFLFFFTLGSTACQPKPVQDEQIIEHTKIVATTRASEGTILSLAQGLPLNEYAISDPYADYVNFDLSDRDLRQSFDDLRMVKFNSRTIWPDKAYLPQGYDPHNILEMGKNPGLGVRALHKQGITGQGIGIALIDQPLNQQHLEYAERLQVYESTGLDSTAKPEMHGAAVASLAVGKTVGTAPGADLYYIATRNGEFNAGGTFIYNYEYTAQAIRRILDINQSLPENRKIRVISMQMSIRSDHADTKEIMGAIEEARQKDIFVIYSNIEDTYGFGFHGLGREPLADPERVESFEPAMQRIEDFDGFFEESLTRLLAPMDSRSIADWTDPDGYIFDRRGGRSWVMPYLAGVYALAVQVEPELTGEQFWTLALEYGQTLKFVTDKGEKLEGIILDPGALIQALQESP